MFKVDQLLIYHGLEDDLEVIYRGKWRPLGMDSDTHIVYSESTGRQFAAKSSELSEKPVVPDGSVINCSFCGNELSNMHCNFCGTKYAIVKLPTGNDIHKILMDVGNDVETMTKKIMALFGEEL